MEWLIAVIVVVFILFVFTVIYFRFPLPLFSYLQGEPQIEQGIIIAVSNPKRGIIEVKFKKNHRFVPTNLHFHHWQHLPKVDDEIEVTYQNRYYRASARSFNWVSYWKSLAQEQLTPVGKVLVAGNRRHLCLGLD